ASLATAHELCLNPPGSQGVLPPPSPLRTGHEDRPSSGSSPWPLSPVLLMSLPMAPGVDQTEVVEVVCPTVTSRDNMIPLHALSRPKGEAEEGTAFPLFLGQRRCFFHIVSPPPRTFFACPPIRPERRVVGRISPCDFGEAGDWGSVGSHQFCLP